MMAGSDILIGIDAGTSVIKAVAFDLGGRQIAVSAVTNRYHAAGDGAVTQSLADTWADCAAALRGLGDRIDGLAARTAAITCSCIIPPQSRRHSCPVDSPCSWRLR